MIKKVLKWTGIGLLTLIVAVTIVTASRQNLKYDAPYPDIKASTDPAVIARGRELAYGPAHCIDCHSTVNQDSLIKLGMDIPLNGGYKFVLPIGDVYSKNITSDKETGIGKFTDAEIARVLRYGVYPDGTAVLDFMPFHNMSDEDLTAVISFLRSQKPAHNKVPDHDFNVLGRVARAFLIRPVGPSEEVPKSVIKDTMATYGKYLAMNIADCQGCHSLRDFKSGAYIGPLFAGGSAMNGLIPPNLTTDSSSRIFGWSQQQFIQRFRTGRIIPQSEMPWNCFSRMSDNDLKALYAFLKTLPPIRNKPGEPQ